LLPDAVPLVVVVKELPDAVEVIPVAALAFNVAKLVPELKS
jgi:hypothetical protein